MIRKDSALDTDRPHYYSQFWIDVASGKRDLDSYQAATTTEHGHDASDRAFDELNMDELEEPLEAPVARPVKPTKPKVEPKRPEPQRPALTSLADLARIDSLMKSSAEMDDDTVPDIESAALGAPGVDEAIVTDFDPNALDLTPAEEEAEPVVAGDEEFGDVQYDEEDEWGEDEDEPRRGSKPNKRRREPRREF
jgi:hypothetical protein